MFSKTHFMFIFIIRGLLYVTELTLIQHPDKSTNSLILHSMYIDFKRHYIHQEFMFM